MSLKQYQVKATVTLEYETDMPTWMDHRQRKVTETTALLAVLARDFPAVSIRFDNVQLSPTNDTKE